MVDDVKKNYFTTGQMRNALIQIEDKMVHSNWMPNIILGINRGGCIPGVYLSHRLKTAHEVLPLLLPPEFGGALRRDFLFLPAGEAA